jgi:hypothetical protein
MRSIGVPQVVEPKVREARLPASRSEAMLNIPEVPAIPPKYFGRFYGDFMVEIQ